MAEEFDADALRIALDATEQAGVPVHLVDQLRRLVAREEAGRAMPRGGPAPSLLSMPDHAVIRQPVGLDWMASPVRCRYEPAEYRAQLEWRNGDSIDCRLTTITELPGVGPHSIRYAGEVGGIPIEFPQPRSFQTERIEEGVPYR